MTNLDPNRNVHTSGPECAAAGAEPRIAMVRVALPYHLRNLAGVGHEVELQVIPPVTFDRILDAIEARFPMLQGTIREYGSGKRRAFLRFFACEEDLSHEPMDAELPAEVASGKEPLLIIGAIAGG